MDTTTKYARDVVAGRRTACRRIVQVCQRHLDERLANGLSWWWDSEKARQGIQFFQRLKIPRGRKAGQNLTPFPWQQFVIGMTFGWRMYHDDDPELEVRRFTDVHVQTARGSGKSPLLAGFVLQGLLDDDEPDPEVHVIASRAEQAYITWSFLEDMVRWSEDGRLLTHEYVNGRLKPRPCPVELQFMGGKDARTTKALHVTGPLHGKAVMVSAESSGRGATGANSSRIIVDEYHDFRTDFLKNRYESGRKARAQPLTVSMTNAGESDQSPYGQEYLRLCRILDGKVPDDPHLLPLIYEPDIEDEPFEQPETWEKMNPSLKYGLPGEAGVRREIRRAMKSQSDYASVSRFQFCIWTKAANPWLPPKVVNRCLVEDLSPESERLDKDCYVSLDLGVNRSLSSVCLLWDMDDGTLEAEIACWGNEEHLLAKTAVLNIPFDRWFREGGLMSQPELAEKAVVSWLAPRIRKYRVRGMTMDTEKAPQVRNLLRRQHGFIVKRGEEPPAYSARFIRYWPHPQGWTNGASYYDKGVGLWMTSSIDHAEEMLGNGKVKVLETMPVRYGLEVAQVERKNKMAIFVKDGMEDLPNDPAVVIAEACGLRDLFVTNRQRGDAVQFARDFYNEFYDLRIESPTDGVSSPMA